MNGTASKQTQLLLWEFQQIVVKPDFQKLHRYHTIYANYTCMQCCIVLLAEQIEMIKIVHHTFIKLKHVFLYKII